ncbi:MAG: hypothetical protein GC162_16865 [Planctomycetes bacterium]|nr:hypothetical protein [Planctomycetota bacterium]
MTERYPDDSTLLALTEDAATGVEYIPTGQSPYYLHFRKLVQRMLLATGRANDLRVYQDGEMTVGVRSGRYVISNALVTFDGDAAIALTNNATNYLWLDAAGAVQIATDAMPADRASFVPLAEVVTDAGAVTSILDRRSEAMVMIPNPSALGLTATADEINQALDGIAATVDAAALTTLTAGPTSTADAEHRHEQLYTDADDETEFRLVNSNAGSSAMIMLRFDLPNRMPDVVDLLPDIATGYLQQRSFGQAYALVGTTHMQFAHEGALTASQTGKLIGVVPIDGVVSNVILSVGSNLDTDTPADAISATVMVNGAAVTSTAPALSDAAGAGFRSTDAGDGTPAVVKSDGTQNVTRGQVLTLDLTRTVSGSVTTEATNVVVLVVIRASKPE